MPRWPENWNQQRGEIEVVAGPMFAGKSDEIIRRADRWKRMGVSVYIVKHPLDVRYEGLSKISSHSGKSVDCEALANPMDVYRRVQELDPCIVVIDEVQFYIDCQKIFVEMVRKLADEGRIVMLAGLNMDFTGEPFGPMAVLMAIAEKVTKLTAVCSVCGAEAVFTQRIIGGEPASMDSPLVVVGSGEAYTDRCRLHHEVPGKSKFADLFG
jgi:thymidine kinase